MAGHCARCQSYTRSAAQFCANCGEPVRALLESGNDETGYRSYLQETSYLAPEWRRRFEAALGRANGKLTIRARPKTPGKYRHPMLVAVLPHLTFGLYAFYWWWTTGHALRRVLDQREPAPVRDLILLILTGGLWRLQMHYNYATCIAELQERLQLPRSDYLRIVCPILSLFMLGSVAAGLMQRELNQIWPLWQESYGN